VPDVVRAYLFITIHSGPSCDAPQSSRRGPDSLQREIGSGGDVADCSTLGVSLGSQTSNRTSGFRGLWGILGPLAQALSLSVSSHGRPCGSPEDRKVGDGLRSVRRDVIRSSG
jgi:hypothetical protein